MNLIFNHVKLLFTHILQNSYHSHLITFTIKIDIINDKLLINIIFLFFLAHFKAVSPNLLN